MTNWKEFADTHVERLRGPEREDAYFRLVEAGGEVVPFLIEAFRAERDPTVRSDLVEIVWQHRTAGAIGFLSEALDDPAPGVWKSGLDGLVTLGGSSAMRALRSARRRAGGGGRRERARLAWIDEAIEQVGEQRRPQVAGEQCGVSADPAGADGEE